MTDSWRHSPFLSPLWTGTLMTAPHRRHYVQGWGCSAWSQWWKRIADGLYAAVGHGCCGGAAPGGSLSGEGRGLRCQIPNRIPYCGGSGGWSHASSCPRRLSPAQLRREPQEQRGGQNQDSTASRYPQMGWCHLLTLQRKMRRKTRMGCWSEGRRSACVAVGAAVSVPGQNPPCSP